MRGFLRSWNYPGHWRRSWSRVSGSSKAGLAVMLALVVWMGGYFAAQSLGAAADTAAADVPPTDVVTVERVYRAKGQDHVVTQVRRVTVPTPAHTILQQVVRRPVTVTNRVVSPGHTVTVTGPAQTVTKTVTSPGHTVTVTGPAQTVTKTVTSPGHTVTVTGPTQTVTDTVTSPRRTVTVTGPTQTVTNTVTQPARTVTETVTDTVTATVTVTVPGTGGKGSSARAGSGAGLRGV